MASQTFAIANPAAGRGTSQAKLSALRELLALNEAQDFVETTSAGEEELLADRALDAGARAIIVIGGDGTCGRVAARILRRKSGCALGVIPAGTGNDFAKTLGVNELSIEDAVRVALGGREVQIDVGRTDNQYFLNSCGFGFDASVLEASNKVTWLKGNAVYVYAALAQLFSYKGISVGIDERPSETKLMITVSNGRFLGGAFHIAPTASVVDGKLDVNYFDNCSVLERVRVFAGAIRGTHQAQRAVTSEKRDRVTFSFSEPPLMEIDGELRRASARTVSIECMPRALSVIAAPKAVL